ncbi:MAG: dTMP kinase [Desulfobacterales bacterium]|nr:dTMP kinase [Desulfobacterales bacterium]
MFITLEGIEGSGKSTQIGRIVKHLEALGHSCLVTKEPGGTEIGEQIRALLLDPGNSGLDTMAELLLYEADRAQHVSRVVKPALNAGKTVICDRFCDSTVVYQGEARGIPPAIIEKLNSLVLGSLRPDITFLLDLPPETGLSRAWKQIDSGIRRQGESRFEREKLRFHESVRHGYLVLAEKEPERIRVIEADQPEQRVGRAIAEELDRFLQQS